MEGLLGVRLRKLRLWFLRPTLNKEEKSTQYTAIFLTLEANSKRFNDFSLIWRKPNEILQFKWKRLMVLKFKPKLNSKFMLKGSKTIKIMKSSKSNRGLTQVEAIFFANKQAINNKVLWQRKSTLKKTVSDCAVRSEHRMQNQVSKRQFLFRIP